jgi:hypothetical protein
MSRPAISFVLLLAASLGFGGVGRFVHEWSAEAAELGGHVAVCNDAAEQQPHDGGSPTDHRRHDHEHCVVCQALAAPRIDRLPGTLIVTPVVDPPRRGPAPVAAIPHCVVVPTSTDARAPPAAPRA